MQNYLHRIPLPQPSHPRNRVLVTASKGGGGGKAGGGKHKGGGPKKQPSAGFGPPVSRVKKAGNSQQQPASFLSSPITVELQDELTKTEFAETPRWDTFCNHLSGEWVGQYGAYTPWEAKPEPVWQDDNKKYLDWVYSRCIEYPGQLDEEAASSNTMDAADTGEEVGASGVPPATEGSVKSQREIALTGGVDQLLLRRLTRAAGLEQLSNMKLEALEGAALTAQEESAAGGGSDESVDVEALSNNTNGVVFFNGGNYSAGPDFIGPPSYKILKDEGPSTDEDDAPRAQTSDAAGGRGEQAAGGAGEDGEEEQMMAAPGSISIMESCLVDWASKSRVRLKVTVRITHDPDNGEVDLEVLRVLLFREFWVGQLGASAANVKATVQESGMDKEPCTQLPRASRTSLHGSWAVFTTSALAIEDCNPFTGEPTVTWVYMTNEDRQLWQVPGGPPDADDDSGAALWLPGGAVVSLRMVDLAEQEGGISSSSSNSEEEEGETGASVASTYKGDPQEASSASHQQHQLSQASDSNGSSSSSSSSSSRPARGLSFGLSWCLPTGSGAGASLQVCSIDRDYDGAGVLRGVRSSTAVKGGWSGGKM